MSSIAHIVVMGVSGSGKSTVGACLAERLGCEFAEGDDFHPPPNVAKMSAGIPLKDEDRWPWLAAIAAWIGERERAGRAAVIACSALKRTYRDALRGASPHVAFVHLAAPPGVMRERMRTRKGHFMPTSMATSQQATLEPLGREERGITVDASRPVEEVVEAALAVLSLPPPAADATPP